MSPSFHALNCHKQLLKHVAVGMGAASFWRGAWYVLDDQLFPDNAPLSSVTCLAVGTAGMAASQGVVARAMAVQTYPRAARFGALYTIAMSCILVWRGTWVGWDCIYEHYHNHYLAAQKQRKEASDGNNSTIAAAASSSPLMATSSSAALEHSPAHAAIKSTDPWHLTMSGLSSHLFAIVALGSAGVFASVLAPPAAVSVIKDLAIQASSSASRRAGTTTAIIKNKKIKARDDVDNQAFEFLPHLAQYLKNNPLLSSSSTSSSTTTAATRNLSTQVKTQTTVFTKRHNHEIYKRHQ